MIKYFNFSNNFEFCLEYWIKMISTGCWSQHRSDSSRTLSHSPFYLHSQKLDYMKSTPIVSQGQIQHAGYPLFSGYCRWSSTNFPFPTFHTFISLLGKIYISKESPNAVVIAGLNKLIKVSNSRPLGMVIFVVVCIIFIVVVVQHIFWIFQHSERVIVFWS